MDSSSMSSSMSDTSNTSATDSMMSMSDMMMVFFTSHTTPLYSTGWTPSSTGQYAGTCIFLILLATILRALLAVKAWKEAAWLDAEFNRRYVTVAGKPTLARELEESVDRKQMVLSENGVEESVVVVKKRGHGRRVWRLSIDPVRACLDTVIAGVGYLLMLAIMTMNVGYFLSVLAGTFLGSVLLGRYATTYEH